MDIKFSVLIRIDPDHRRVRLVTTGHLTETNQRALYPWIRHAQALTPGTEVVVDLTAIHHLEDAALDLLRWEVEHDDTERPDRPVRLVLTEPPAAGRPSSSPAGGAPGPAPSPGRGPPPGPAPSRNRPCPVSLRLGVDPVAACSPPVHDR